jgi:hypothetical protein
MFSMHVGAIAMILLYIPYIYSAVIGFLHFVCFVVLIILNICIQDAEPGNGNRTKGTRVVWGRNICLMQSWASSTSCSSSEDSQESERSIADFATDCHLNKMWLDVAAGVDFGEAFA